MLLLYCLIKQEIISIGMDLWETMWGVICFGDALVFFLLTGFIFNTVASNLMLNELIYRLFFNFISRISSSFWFVGQVRWMVSVSWGFLLGVFSNRLGLKSWIILFIALIIKLLSNMSLALLSFKSIKHFVFNFINNNLRYFLKLFRNFLKIVYCCWNIFISSKKNFSKRLTINIFVLSTNFYLDKTRLTSSKNMYQIIHLINFINANLEKVTIYNLPRYFTVFCSILLKIVSCAFNKFFKYVTLLFCLLIVQRGLIILFIFDIG